MKEIKVSIVIVCMNNLKNLYPCLDSIKKYTTVSYETLVVAYLFSEENLQKLRVDYPWVTIIESKEIRGFSENNNLALRQAKGEYCFVVNDDTFVETPVIDDLVSTIENLPEDIVVISPNILYPDGSPQCCGREPMNWTNYVKYLLHLPQKTRNKKYSDKKGIFQSYNILGAAFLIKYNIFKQIGFFNEQYFFCPEDIAVSTLLNNIGYKCFVNSEILLYHIGGGSGWSKIMSATEPSAKKGSVIFYSGNSLIKRIILKNTIFITSLFDYLLFKIMSCIKDKNYYQVKAQAKLNNCFSIFTKKTPKEIFSLYYKSQINN